MRSYNLSKQVSVLSNSDEYYLYNWFNDIGVSIEPKNITQIQDDKVVFADEFSADHIKFLCENTFISNNKLPVSFYETEFNKQLKKEQDSLRLILLPAGYACNFRCLYCYENHEDASRFKDEHNDKIFSLLQSKNAKQVHIEYFGGEPLLNYKWIISFQNRIKDFKHTASMTTNGYLLTEDKFLSLLENNVRTFQITIDGVKETHNKLRIKCDGSGTYETIINNLKKISQTQEKFTIILRCNFNQNTSSAESRKKFFNNLEFLQNDFRFRIIFRPIGLYSEANGTTTQTTIDACHKGQYDMQNIWESEAQEKGFLIGDLGLFTQTAGFVCYASKNTTYTITPTFEVLKCTLAVDKDYNKFGTLTNHLNLDTNKIKKWEEYIQLDSKCKDCFFFFQCMGRSCVLNNFLSKAKKCPIKPNNERFLVEKIRKQKEILKRTVRDEKNI